MTDRKKRKRRKKGRMGEGGKDEVYIITRTSSVRTGKYFHNWPRECEEESRRRRRRTGH